MPRVSVLLAVFDHAPLLPRAVRSVLAQTEPDWQLVIADDGSTDGSGAVASELAALHPAIGVLHLPHRGLAATLNAAARAATAPLLTFLDADDLYEPAHLEENLRHLSAHPEVDLLTSTARVLGDPWVVDLEAPGEMVHLDRCAIGGTFFVRRDVFAAVGGMPPQGFGMDYHFARRVREAGHRVEKRGGRTYVYDRTLGGAMTKAAEARLRAGARAPAAG